MQKKFDLIVVGGGLCGVAAAIAAAREHLDVLLIEKSSFLGGAACNNLVNPFMQYCRDVNGEKDILNRGIFTSIIQELQNINGIKKGYDSFLDDLFHEEYLKLVLDRMVNKYGVHVLFHTTLVKANYNGEKIENITVFNKSGLAELQADYYIDATGDGDLTALAGLPYELGDEEGRCQPMTLCFNVGNVPYGTMSYFEIRAVVNDLYKEMQKKGKIKNPREDVLIFRSILPNTLHFNSTRIIDKNPVDGEDLTKAEMEAREQVFELFNFLKDNFELFKDSYLINCAPSIGIRESRRVVGEYVITSEDLLACTKFEDSIARGNYPIDIHNPSGSGTVLQAIEEGEYYTIPFRALIPKNVKNLCVAGRCISATHTAQASFRIMPIVCNIGEGAGIAVATAFEQRAAVKDADMKKVHERLTENGAVY